MNARLLSSVAICSLLGVAAAHAQAPSSLPGQPATPATQDARTPAGNAGAAQPTLPVEPQGAAPAPASTVPGQGQGPARPANTLGEVVVTAQRVTQSAQKAAVAIDVIGGSEIRQAGISTPTGLTQLVPALTVQSAGPYNTFFVRGVGNFALTSYSDPAIAFNYDGVYVGRPTSTSGVFYDLDRVEVLKGPQGTLYGRNATGGAINVLPTQPQLGRYSGYLDAGYGNYDAYTLEGAVNAPVGEHGALRISGTVVGHESYLEDGESSQKTQAVRLQFKDELTPQLTFRIAGDYAHDGGSGAGYSYVDHFTFNPALTSLPLGQRYNVTPSNINLSQGALSPESQAFRETATAGPAKRNLDPLSTLPFLDNDYFGTNAQIDYQTKLGTLTVIPAFRGAHLNDLAGIGFYVRQHEDDEQTSVEIRLAKAGVGIFDYNIGFFYYDENILTHLDVDESALQLQQAYTTGTTSYAAFARLTAHLTDKLRLVGGFRYTYDEKRFDGQANNLTLVCTAAACPNAPLFQPISGFNQIPFPVPGFGVPTGRGPVAGTIISRSDVVEDGRQYTGVPTYRGAVEYDVTPRSLLYGSVETGYRSGGFNLAVGFPTFGPEYITALTLGSKNRFFGNRAQLNLEVFDWYYSDQQLSHIGIDLAGDQSNFTQNIGKSTVRGAELDGRILVTPTTLVSGDVQYLDTDYKNFIYQAPAGHSAPPFTTCAVTPDGATLYNVNCSGKPAFNSPKWTLNFAAQQTFDVGEFKIVTGADTQYRSSHYDGFEYASYELVNPTFRSNAFVTFSKSDSRWSLTGYVRNLEGLRTPTFAANNAIGGLGVVIPSDPRTYGVRVSTKF